MNCSTFENIITETVDRVGVVTLHRPSKLNALSDILMTELSIALDRFERDDKIGCIVVTGSERAFAAGADVDAMRDMSFAEAFNRDYITRNWERIRRCRKPVIAAVAGYAFGGGCELAMMCDFIIAADNAVFSQPEVKLGIMPGAGGTQRLPLAIGKSKAMEMCLTGRTMKVQEAEANGLVARIVPLATLREEAIKTAATIASYSLPIVMMIKESINRAYDSTLSEGVMFERRLFHSAFALEDQKEGMTAFLEKREPDFKHG